MPQIREKGTESAGSEISDSDVRFLRSRLETMSPEGLWFYIDAPTIEILAEDHAPSLLVNWLRAILNKRECVDVELLNAAAPTADEIAGIIDRRAASRQEDAAASEVAQEAELEALPEAEASAADVDASTADADASEEDQTADEVLVKDKPLACLVCRGKRFYHRNPHVDSPKPLEFNLGFNEHQTTDCYICSECGYVHWFVT